MIRNNWNIEEINNIYHTPLLDLIYRAATIHREYNETGEVQVCTLGMLNEEQAKKLADAGLYAYNHNLDTSSEYYNEIISTRTYNDRLSSLDNVRKAGVSVCCCGIIGLGETHDDRIGMLHTLST